MSVTSLPTFVTGVAAVRTVTTELREIVLAGGLDGFPSHGADQFVFVIVPTADAPIHDRYTMAEWMASDPRPLGAYYTVRAHDVDAGTITLWAVLHGHDDGVGGWAARCEPGERVAVWGPRAGMGVPTGARSVLLVADTSGVAAVASIVDDLAEHPGVGVDVVVETADGCPVPLPHRPGVSVEWRSRGAAEPGTSGELLDAVRSRHLDTDGLVVFAAGESTEMTAIRRHLRHEVGLTSTAVHATGYWRRRTS